MQRVTRPTAVAQMPAAPADPGDPGYFTGGDPVAGLAATTPGYEWFNTLQEEMAAVIEAADIGLDRADNTQLLQALRRLFGGAVTTVTASRALLPSEAGLVLVDATAGDVTVTLPAAAAVPAGLPYRIMRVDGAAHAVAIGCTLHGSPLGDRLWHRHDAGLYVSAAATWARPWVRRAEHVETITGDMDWPVPPGVWRIWGRVLGGGGGGAGGNGSLLCRGSSGAAGGVAEGWVSVTPGEVIACTVGAAGAGGAGDGGAGGATSLGALMSATGGAGGVYNATGNVSGVNGGMGVGGDRRYRGGASAPVSADYKQLFSAPGTPAGAGAWSAHNVGIAGGQPGAGGAAGNHSPVTAGGAGAAGEIVIRWRA